jgi:hypothetical protein
MIISTIDGYGGRFQFEPPVEVGERNIKTLSELAAIAVAGYDSPELIRKMAKDNVEALLKASSASPELVKVALNSLLDGKHRVDLI